MDTKSQDMLISFLQEHKELWSDSTRLKGVIADLLPKEKGLRNLLMILHENGIVDSVKEENINRVEFRYKTFLKENYGTSAEFVTQAVDVWFRVLGVGQEISHENDEVQSKQSKDTGSLPEELKSFRTQSIEPARKDLLRRKSGKKGPLKEDEVVQFGSYFQDKEGKEKTPIEWIVKEVNGSKALLVSRYALEAKCYNEEQTDITWENSTLRSWLNQEFFTSAFSEEEQKLIIESTVTVDEFSVFDTNLGNDTKDKVFLLSLPEVKKYLADVNERRCAPTAYAKAQGAWMSDSDKTTSGEDACWWWLRSPGNDQSSAAVVRDNGSFNYRGNRVNQKGVTVRAALWIDVKQLLKDVSEVDSLTAEEQINFQTQNTESTRKGGLLRKNGKQGPLKVDETIQFGAYYQDKKGKEKTPIKWIVKEVHGPKVLLVSKYALEAKPYNEKYTNITWEECTLRRWLNQEFYSMAFNAAEQKMIVETAVPAVKNSIYDTDRGNDTKDKIFLLSISEVEKYFEDDRKCVPTAYAIAQGAWTGYSTGYSKKTASGETSCCWWLRLQGEAQNKAAGVNCAGTFKSMFFDVYDDRYCVRPAMWIDLKQ